jgi:predicted transcriptional regulator
MEMTVCIVASYVSHNEVTPQELPELINNVHAMLSKLAPSRDDAQSHRVPAVPISQSITRDYLVCLDDGRRLKTLKRYLRRKYALTPEQYRARWGLPDDYPMVAPGYAELRSSLARRSTVPPGAAVMTKPFKNGPRKS